MIKLNTNENPYGPSPRVLEAIKEAADDSLKLYPDPSCDMLLSAAAEYYCVKQEQIFSGNGSDEVLAFAFQAFFNPGKEVLFTDITYTFYPVYASLFNLDYRSVPVDEGFGIPIEQFFDSKGGVVIANPNAPTGKFLPLKSIEKILKNNKENVVIVDEAYIGFGGDSAVKLIDRYPNLLVVHTFSKSHALAGMRIGFAIGNSELIDALNRIKNCFNSYTLDRLAIIAGTEAFKDKEYFEKTKNMVIDTRNRVSHEMKKLGFEVIDSVTNFIFCGHSKINAEIIFSELRGKGILVRHFNKPRIDNYLRITIGTDEEMDCLLKAVREILKQYGII